MNLNDQRIAPIVQWIEFQRTRGKSWDSLMWANKENEEDLKEFIERRIEEDGWLESLDKELWQDIVEAMRTVNENTLDIEVISQKARIIGEHQDNEITIPTNRNTAWQKYKKHLAKNGFSKIDINSIEESALSTLKQIQIEESSDKPRKGLIVGNVQSGKTANMTGLMAMAADWGINMFIVLSGTIENLRIQTQERMWNDLNQPSNINWRMLNHLSKDCDIHEHLSSLNLRSNSHDRYFTVVLKNSKRLENLHEWLNSDQAQKQNLKIMVIDDEADQAGINTNDIYDETQEKSKISNLINSIVHDTRLNGEKYKQRYHSMNYIAYTATPYANVLNEKGDGTLFPKDFIQVLETSNKYFGPYQMFGLPEENIRGMNVIRILENIDNNELEIVDRIHMGNTNSMPRGLEKSLLWFLASAAALRSLGFQAPLTMLIHTSFKTEHHHNIDKTLFGWFSSNEIDEIIKKVQDVWLYETSEWTKEDFVEMFPNYDNVADILDYPRFEDFEDELRLILQEGLGRVEFNDDAPQGKEFFEGIHVSVDNSVAENFAEDIEIMRLHYPSNRHNISKAPLFIVIGGNTLSRGLTLKGLISTYFLRKTNQADTLMQMGRWFGFRQGYELYPRVFMEYKAYERFSMLSQIDYELRQDIIDLEKTKANPEDVGVRVKTSPNAHFLRITSNMKMQSAKLETFNYSGVSHQTVIFDNDIESLRNNISVTKDFIKSIGVNSQKEYLGGSHTKVWENIKSSHIFNNFLNKMHFSSRARMFNDLKMLDNWVKENEKKGKLGNWNVVFGSIENSTNGVFKIQDDIVINKVSRTQRPETAAQKDIIDIGALRAPKDLLADVTVDKIRSSNINRSKLDNPRVATRSYLGLSQTPQLLIYCIDKNSEPSVKSNRVALGVDEDIIGVVITLPIINEEQAGVEALRIK